MDPLFVVVGGVAVNKLSDYVKWSEFLRLRDQLKPQNPGQLNHDLEKLLKESIICAIEHIVRIEKGKRQPDQEVIAFLKELVKVIAYRLEIADDVAVSAAMKDFLFKKSDPQAQNLGKVERYLELPGNFPSKIADLMEAHFIPQVQLCFTQGLKDENHRDAWIAFQKMHLEMIQGDTQAILAKASETEATLSELKTGLDDIRASLASLAPAGAAQRSDWLSNLGGFLLQLRQNPVSEAQIEAALSQQIARIEADLGYLREGMDELKGGVRSIQTGQKDLQGQMQRMQVDWLSRKMVLAYGLVAMLLLSMGGYWAYQQAQPFDLTLIVQDAQGRPLDALAKGDKLLLPPGHTLMTDTLAFTRVALVLDGEPRWGEVDAQGNVYFRQLDSRFRGDSLPIQLEGGFWRLTDSSASLGVQPPNLPLRLTRTEALCQVRVRLKYAGQPLPDQPIEVRALPDASQVLATGPTGPDGRLSLRIPPEACARQYLLQTDHPQHHYPVRDTLYPEAGELLFLID